MNEQPVYLDCNATTPVDPRVVEVMLRVLKDEVGNAGSTSHAFGSRAKQWVQQARNQIAEVVGVRRHEIVFTSGATEANNLALLGLARHGQHGGRRHIVSTQIEHKAVLEPLQELKQRGFEITLVPPTAGGWVEPEAVAAAVRDDTLAVSVMQANNETGIRQGITEIAELLRHRDVYFHVDAAQGFGKELGPLQHERIDLISISGHKIFGPQGIGALIVRRRGRELPPLVPLAFGGGQELGLRPGTLPVALIAGFGEAARLAAAEWADRARRCELFGQELLRELGPLQPAIHGDRSHCLPHVVNLSIPGLDAELTMEAVRPFIAVSDGAACTSICSTASHVLAAMRLPPAQVDGAIRLSWCHATPTPDWKQVVCALSTAQQAANGKNRSALEK